MENGESLEEISGDWAQVESPYSAISSKFVGDRSSIILQDDFFGESSAFPPPNHEDLPIAPPNDDSQVSREYELTVSPSSPSKWKKSLRLGFLQSGISWMAANKSMTNFACKVGRLGLALAFGSLASLVAVFFLRRRVILSWHKRMRANKSDDSLVLLISQKDEKIERLLVQIARMNEILQARRKIPVIRVRTSS